MRVEITFEEDAHAAISDRTCDQLWAIESDWNRLAAEAYWQRATSGSDLTIFRHQSIAELLPTVLEHHPDCDILVVRGVEATHREAWNAARSHGFEPLRHARGILRFGRRSK